MTVICPTPSTDNAEIQKAAIVSYESISNAKSTSLAEAKNIDDILVITQAALSSLIVETTHDYSSNMAKQRSVLTLDEMEKRLGYKVAVLDNPNEKRERFYSDLTPVPESVYEQTRKELDDYHKREQMQDHRGLLETNALAAHFVKKIEYGEDVVHIQRRSYTSLYSFTVDIRYGSDFSLPLVLTANDVLKLLVATRPQYNWPESQESLLFKLPQELRDAIYELTLPDGKWEKSDINNEFDISTFFTGLGDPDGFYFPLNKELGVLMVNKQIRREVLPLAFQNTLFYFDDMDDFIRFGVSIGSIGRRNITSLEFSWESKADLCLSPTVSDEDSLLCRLPSIHVSRCISLLKQFRKLKRLRLWFDSEVLSNMSLDDFKMDPGIDKLCSLQGLKHVDILSFGVDPTACPISAWLKETMEHSTSIGRQIS
ncbi:uncharacterized protein GIQ15_06916 [Arthroderma uncinatum]|uniref:uncharacterized protein n=1 Tax=Arthroderma uncinatum TaxID=74035 RepID=UPI00144A52AD|nr:uncharacterized protein GIQ15_06916 [Arthroderma uncinatum]KAF3479940.1 hypothetical protein GIQ15_06916 [Arthroderma uncinatum]